MIMKPRGGGGNRVFAATGSAISAAGASLPIIIRRNAAIGDALCSTVVAQKLHDQGFQVIYQTHPHIHCVLKRVPWITQVQEPGGYAHVNLDGAYENDPSRRVKHFVSMFMDVANSQLAPRGITLGPAFNCKPKMVLPDVDIAATMKLMEQYPRPWVFICPRSDTYTVRQVPDYIWGEAAGKIAGTKFWIGRHGPPPANMVNFSTQHFDDIIHWLSVADLLVTVDTGPMHVAAALGVPVVAIGQSSSPELHLNDQNDFITISPKLDCLNCQENVCPKASHIPPCQYVDPEFIASWVNARLRSITDEDVSAIVPIYQPNVNTLNTCLQHVLDQVGEIIVTAEQKSIIPEGAMTHPKIRYVRSPQAGIGYGRNVNFGARHSNGKYLLLLNDDVFLDPGAVDALKREMVGSVGMVAHLLMYPEGVIYHAGKARTPGERGWGHIDYRKHVPSITQPTEMENVCGASVLVRREAFYQIDGFDEEFFIYAEDDDFALRMRRAGWRIMYTPHARGIHMEHQSTDKIGNIGQLVSHANGTFGRKWSKYFDHNANRVPGTFDYV